jgi:hypothetical protein
MGRLHRDGLQPHGHAMHRNGWERSRQRPPVRQHRPSAGTSTRPPIESINNGNPSNLQPPAIPGGGYSLHMAIGMFLPWRHQAMGLPTLQGMGGATWHTTQR